MHNYRYNLGKIFKEKEINKDVYATIKNWENGVNKLKIKALV